MVKNKEREHHWLVTQERALETYEKIQTSTDCDTWEVFVNSAQKTMSLKDALKNCEKRLDPLSNDGSYSPSIVSVDLMLILNKIPSMMKQFSENLEHSFRGVIIVNEDMNKYVESLESETEGNEAQTTELQEEIEKLSQEKAKLEHENKVLREGFLPIKDILMGRVSDIIKLCDEFKKYGMDEKRVKELAPYIQREIDFTFNLVDARRKYLVGEVSSQPQNTSSNESYSSPMQETVRPPLSEDTLPPGFEKYPLDVYKKAITLLEDKKPMLVKIGLYEAELKVRCGHIMDAIKKKAKPEQPVDDDAA